jgi:hypothetical protein
MSAYVYLWDIFACVCVRASHGILSLSFWLRSIKKVLKIYNWDLYFYLFLGMEEDAAADSPPHALASAGPISVAVGALCWWDMERKHGSHTTYTVPTLQFVIFSAGYLFRLYSWACNHVMWKHFISFMGEIFTFFFFFLLYILILI